MHHHLGVILSYEFEFRLGNFMYETTFKQTDTPWDSSLTDILFTRHCTSQFMSEHSPPPLLYHQFTQRMLVHRNDPLYIYKAADRLPFKAVTVSPKLLSPGPPKKTRTPSKSRKTKTPTVDPTPLPSYDHRPYCDVTEDCSSIWNSSILPFGWVPNSRSPTYCRCFLMERLEMKLSNGNNY